MLTLPRGHLLAPENLRDLAADAKQRAWAATTARYSAVRWDQIEYCPAALSDAVLDKLESSGRVIARVGHAYLLRPPR